MKHIYIFHLIIFMALISTQAKADLKAACLPDTEEAKDWPVGVIYLHGLYPWPGYENTNPNGPGAEKSNRVQLKKLAEQLATLKVRIALPVAPRKSISDKYGINRAWSRVEIEKVESEAQKACGGARLARSRALVGFSNGGYEVAGLAGDCKKMSNYSKLVAIGAPGSLQKNSCGTLINKTPHVFPKADELEALLKGFHKNTGVTSGSNSSSQGVN